MPESPAALAEARCRAYGLFSALALDGLVPDVGDLIEAVPEIAVVAERSPDGRFDFDAAAAHHYEALSHQVFPFRSVFVTLEAQPGGLETERAKAFYDRIGFRIDLSGASADHVGLMLGAMAFLLGAEADAHADGRGEVVAEVRRLERALLDEQLLFWWPALAETLVFGDFRLYVPWAEAVTQLVLHHRDELGAPASAEPPNIDIDASSLSTRLDEPHTGLRDIADTLLVPVQVGAFLTRRDLRALGRGDRLPGGFGARSTVLTNLLKSAATYEVLDGLVAGLRGRLEAARRFYEDYQDRSAAAAPAGRWWAARCAETQAAVARLTETEPGP